VLEIQSRETVALSLSLIIPVKHILTLQTLSHGGKVKMKLLDFVGKKSYSAKSCAMGFFVCLVFNVRLHGKAQKNREVRAAAG